MWVLHSASTRPCSMANENVGSCELPGTNLDLVYVAHS